MDIKRMALIASFLMVCMPVRACPPEQSPEQRLQEALQAKKDLALAEVESDAWQGQPVTAFAILKVKQGWGAPKKLHLTYSRQETDCPPPQKLEKGARYLVVLDFYKVTDIFEYSTVKKPLKALGDPDYKYNRKNKLTRKSAD